MTLVVDRTSDGPQLHVLAIGVAAYRYLAGGSHPVAHDTLQLKQLDGPQHSVKAFVEWVTQRMSHPTARLGTVELLSSPPVSFPPEDPVEPEVPSLANVKAAFERWFERCDRDPRNVPLFYFCGHGVEREAAYLLLEDFGHSKLRLLENAVDIDTTYQGMARCKAHEQYFFVDSCREIPFELLEMLSGEAAVLVTPKLVGDRRSHHALVFATAPGAKAFGKPGKVTRFTEALLRAFDGLGSRAEGNRWVVDVPNVQRALTRLLRGRADGAPLQVPSLRGAGAGVVHRLSGVPTVPVEIVCDPTAAVSSAAVALDSVTGGATVRPPTSCEFGWTIEAPADVYRLTVEFPQGNYRRHEDHLTAWPPGLDARIEVRS